MRSFVESLKILYSREPKEVTEEKLNQLLTDEKLSQEEYDYITGA